jgi:hypothetical protein
MNIYLCSTVRNLLFALLKSLDETAEQSLILLIWDQQNIDTTNYDLSGLPDHIQIRFITRSAIRNHLNSSISGRLLRQLAAMNIRTTARLRHRIRARLFRDLIKAENFATTEPKQLFLFNDRNQVARLLRLAFSDYAIIEDGLSNYSGQKLKLTDRLQHALTGNRAERRYLGDDKRCKEIFLLQPDNAPEALKPKVRPITFIDSRNIIDVCYSFFQHQPEGSHTGAYSCLLATQPFIAEGLTASGFDLVIYRKLIDRLQSMGIRVALKIHPREHADRYRKSFPDCEILESKIPLELLIFGAEEKCDIVSIYSTAGMGFEEHCQRLTLLNEDEAEKMSAVFDTWRNDEALLDKRIDSLFQ